MEGRVSSHPVDEIFMRRWSPRAFSEADISDAELATIFEAARWAPSCFNLQPWRFLYVRRGGARWSDFLDLLSDFNRVWAHRASALIVIASQTTMMLRGAEREEPNYTHSFDTGAAWGMLALQAALSGWHTHAISGFDIDRARTVLSVPDDYRLEAAVAIGRIGDKSVLPEKLAAREAPSSRRPLREIVFEGGFPRPAAE